MKKYLAIFITAIISIIFLTGCFNPVFYEVRKDVAPEEATVNGTINGITRYTIGTQEYIVLAANGGIKYKEVEHSRHGGWKLYKNLPFALHAYNFENNSHNGHQILKVLANEDTLFIVTATYKHEDESGTVCPDKCYVWAKKFTSSWDEEDGWKAIIDGDNETYFPIYMKNLDIGFLSAFNVFQTNSTHKENRHVYLRRGDPNCDNDNYKTVTYYELTYDDHAKEKNSVKILDSDSDCANSAFAKGSEVYFFNSSAIISDETYSKNATRLYIAKGSSIHYGDVGNLSSTTSTNFDEKYPKTSSVGANISSLAYCTDALIIGCADYSVTTLSSDKGGIYRITLDTTNTEEKGKPAGSTSDFRTNATFQLPSTYYVPCVLNATPGEAEEDSNLYASAIVFGAGASSQATYANVGLWSYYPGRGNWNRE